MPDSSPSGFLNINKPLSVTSHDVVAQVRRKLKLKKVGHAGTLDPLATGVLVICVGRATRLSQFAMDAQKSYRAVVKMGAETDTYDAEGQITATYDAGSITKADVEKALPRFMGVIEQVPPMYSAIKQGGKKLYELARAGQAVERPPRSVRIDTITITSWQHPQFEIDVACGSGTYIRSLAYDVGRELGVGAHLAGLTRTSSGAFRLKDAVSLDVLFESDDWTVHMQPIDTVVQHLPAVHVRQEDVLRVKQGQPLKGYELVQQLARAYDPEHRLIALLKPQADHWQPHKVFI